MKNAVPGTWESPLTAEILVETSVRPIFTQLMQGELYWDELRPHEGGRTVVVSQTHGDLLPEPWNASTRVHEMGGLSWTVLEWNNEIGVLFANASDQRLYWKTLTADPVAISPELPEGTSSRYCDMILRGDEIWCIRETVVGHKVERDIISMTSDGQVRVLDNSSHFYAHLRLSPSTNRLAWISWEHPQMPWDGTELRVADIDETGNLVNIRPVAGALDEAVNSPVWASDESLYYLSDASGWWNVWHTNLAGESTHTVQDSTEWASPMWLVGFHWLRILPDGKLVALRGEVEHLKIAIVDPVSRTWLDCSNEMTFWQPLAVEGETIAGVCAGPRKLSTVVTLNASDPNVLHVVRANELPVDQAYYSIPHAVTLPSQNGREVHAFYYAATNPDFTSDDIAPVIVFAHGGPTANVYGVADNGMAWFTSRGFSIVDVNYGGSTGYGQDYRRLLKGQWGVVDTEDIIAVVHGLIEQGLATSDKVLIRGGSAGGFAVLNSLVHSDVFAAGADYFGVADLAGLAEDTHDFESRYLDSLVGPYPERSDLYRERSPLTHADSLSAPVIFFQGLDDPIVPPLQSEAFRDACIRNNLTYKYFEFEGEAHGFKKKQTLMTCAKEELIFYGEVLGFSPHIG